MKVRPQESRNKLLSFLWNANNNGGISRVKCMVSAQRTQQVKSYSPNVVGGV